MTAGVGESRAATGAKFREAVWPDYNLVSFAVSERDSWTAVGIRPAFEEAEGFTTTNARASTPPDPASMRAPQQRVARLLGTFIDAAAPTQSSALTRRDS